jgi:hypothetical protein
MNVNLLYIRLYVYLVALGIVGTADVNVLIEKSRKSYLGSFLYRETVEMRTLTRILIIALIASCMFAIVPNQVRANENSQSDSRSVQLVVISAGYLDLDHGGSPNDVLTDFQIRILSSDYMFHSTKIYSFLTLPSGKTFSVAISFKGPYSSLELVIGWLNVATESGWYTFSAFAFLSGGPNDGFAFAVATFDPPTGGDPGPPLIGTMSVDVLP